MAFISALVNLRYDFNNYVVELRRISNLATIFLMEDDFIKSSYINEVEMSINNYEFRFNNERNPFKQREILIELKEEIELKKKSMIF